MSADSTFFESDKIISDLTKYLEQKSSDFNPIFNRVCSLVEEHYPKLSDKLDGESEEHRIAALLFVFMETSREKCLEIKSNLKSQKEDRMKEVGGFDIPSMALNITSGFYGAMCLQESKSTFLAEYQSEKNSTETKDLSKYLQLMAQALKYIK